MAESRRPYPLFRFDRRWERRLGLPAGEIGRRKEDARVAEELGMHAILFSDNAQTIAAIEAATVHSGQ